MEKNNDIFANNENKNIILYKITSTIELTLSIKFKNKVLYFFLSITREL